MYRIILVLILFFTSFRTSAQLQITPSHPDFCSTSPVTFSVVSPVPTHQYNWSLFNHFYFGCYSSPGGMGVGTGTSVTVNLANYPKGATILVEERDQNGLTLGYLQQPVVADVIGNTIPYCIDTTGCKEIRVPDAFVDGMYRLKSWFKDGVLMQDPVYSVIRGPFFGTQTFEYTMTGVFCGIVLSTGPIVINGPPRPAVTATGSLVRCMGDSVLLTAPPNVNGIVWLHNNVTIQGSSNMTSIYAKATGDYKVMALLGNCNNYFYSDSVSLQFLPAPIVTGANTGCYGDSVLLSTSGYSTYTWKRNGSVIPGAISPNIYVKQTGIYEVQCTTGTCGTSVPKQVTFYPWPVVTVNPSGPVTTCASQTITLTASGTNIASCKWYRNNVLLPGADSTSLFITKNGNYKCIASNASGCTRVSNIVQVSISSVSDLPKKTINIQPDSSGKDTYISTGNYNGNFGSKQYLETSNRVMTSSIRSLLQFNLSDIPVESPIVSANLKLNVDSTFIFTTGSSQTLYFKRILNTWSENSVNFNSILDSSDYQYSMISGSGIVSHSLMNVSVTDMVKYWVSFPLENKGLMLHFDESAGGNYAWIRFFSSDHSVASQRPKLSVTYYYADIIANAPLNICNGGSVVLKTNSGNYTYQWFKNGVPVSGATDSIFTANSAGQYKVTITSASGCSVTSQVRNITVNAMPSPGIVAVPNDTFCYGSYTWLIADSISGYSSFQWRRNGSIISGATQTKLKVTQAGSYTVEVTSNCGVSSASTPLVCTIITNPLPVITANGPTTFCNGQYVMLTANSTSGITNKWLRNSVEVSGGGFYFAYTAGAYQLKQTGNGCSRTSGVTNIIINCRTGDLPGSEELLVIPQPFTHEARIVLPHDIDPGSAEFSLFDLNGKLVKHFKCEGTETLLQREELSSGMYILQTNSNGSMIAVQRILIE